MSWIGDTKYLLRALDGAGADRGDEGRFIISTTQAITGLGGIETVVSDGTTYYVNNEPKDLMALLRSAENRSTP